MFNFLKNVFTRNTSQSSKRTERRPQRARLAVEGLESRDLMAAYIAASGDLVIRFEGNEHVASLSDIRENEVGVAWRVTFNTGLVQDFAISDVRTNRIVWAPSSANDSVYKAGFLTGGPTITQLSTPARLPAQPQTNTRTPAPVNTRTPGDQFDSANASSSNGMSVVVWTDRYSETDTDIKARVYDANGKPFANEITVANAPRIESQPSVAMDSYGDFVVVWTDQYSDNDWDVRARRFSRTGEARDAASFYVAGEGNIYEYAPSVAVDANGNFVVAYATLGASGDADVKARLFADSGALLGEIPIAASGQNEGLPSVARMAEGPFVIAYEVDYTTGEQFEGDIRLQRFYANGALVDGGYLQIAKSVKHETAPSVSINSNGTTVVAYQELDGGDFDIKAVKVSANAVLGAPITIARTTSNEQSAAVILDRASDNFAVAYEAVKGTASSVQVREVTATGALGAAVNLGAGMTQPAISVDGNHYYFLTMTQGAAGRQEIKSSFRKLANQQRVTPVTPPVGGQTGADALANLAGEWRIFDYSAGVEAGGVYVFDVVISNVRPHPTTANLHQFTYQIGWYTQTGTFDAATQSITFDYQPSGERYLRRYTAGITRNEAGRWVTVAGLSRIFATSGSQAEFQGSRD